ncbi:centriole, cilia and spindle-associated protein [Gadus macrocephalus]|uniref:centriole, cilia and spindle-associated protein n=1 Tax=Gadus macrocephalus TaxID=80720 RepID=UPI0028CB18F6|nr:centriole, cilia and spindle-associated protein [Gadus macrocephalus]XP_059927828.1 centriole, cilia and spindle-associated protein [Gadus macrocephalus]XP_059927829.1 centriole, cilia and spindle-associated protein [Gadus macrocephalus]
MVTMRIRTEYMKKFKDPKWESYSKCYEELFRYRMARRLLEHSHNPWFWSGSDTDSDVSESPTQSNKKPTETVTAGDRQDAEEYEQCRGDGRVRQGRHRVTLPGSTETVPKIQLPEEVEDASHTTSAVNGGQREGVAELRPQVEEESEEQRANSRCSNQPPTLAKQPDQERVSRHPERVKTASRSTKAPQLVKRVRSAPKHRPRDESMEGRHPFALYGQGERAADMAAKRTHNVGPAASTGEIHESALRAKTRRDVERLLQTQRVEQRRAKSADLDKKRTGPEQPEFNPWLTEYMRCFSARAR